MSDFQKQTTDFLKEAMKQELMFLQTNPGAIFTDVETESDEQGEIRYVSYYVAPKNPEDAEAFKELYERAKEDPYLWELMGFDKIGKEEEN